MAKLKTQDDQAKVCVVATQRIVFTQTDETYEKGSTIFVNPETAKHLIEIGLVELSEEPQTTQAEEITQKKEQ